MARRVVVIDASADWRHLLALAARHGGLEVVGEADSAERGIAVAWATRPDVVIAEHAEGAFSGSEWIAALRLASRGAAIVLYGIPLGSRDRAQALELGATRYFDKLLMSPRALVDAVIDLTDQIDLTDSENDSE